ncbi:glycosyltransferase family 2 protein [Paenibacillus aquistagni]|uniref:Glucosyl-3-phosphoglycerate synthase n=1 Tax=Paenibacillus aquistagni TaxID=1852522 RepID=A0A1X7LTQ7_9BACL|nr:glycosyltransferase [Paenibacillus aquistagni]SMG56703.1 Glycosyl transferase family 2 [Paenibacillus aquistagni]
MMHEDQERVGSEEQIAQIKRLSSSSPTSRAARARRREGTRLSKSSRWMRSSRAGRRSKRSRMTGKQRRGKARRVRSRNRIPMNRGAVLPTGYGQLATAAGERDGQRLAQEGYHPNELQRFSLQARQAFAHFAHTLSPGLSSYPMIPLLSDAYMQGLASAFHGQLPTLMLLPTTMKLSVVMCAMNEEGRIGSVLQEVNRLALDEIYIVVNGSTDRTLEEARISSPQATIVHYPERVGHDVGRSIGAKLTRSEAVLFVDSDIAVPAEQLGAFLWSIAQGVDVALNDITPLLPPFDRQDSISYCKQWLNACLGRPDLESNSLTAVPHALSRQAIDRVGIEALSVPPRAQALALLHGLRTETAATIDVITHNQVKTTNSGANNQVAQLILGDHLEAFHTIWSWKGNALNEPQHSRQHIAVRRNRE